MKNHLCFHTEQVQPNSFLCYGIHTEVINKSLWFRKEGFPSCFEIGKSQSSIFLKLCVIFTGFWIDDFRFFDKMIEGSFLSKTILRTAFIFSSTVKIRVILNLCYCTLRQDGLYINILLLYLDCSKDNFQSLFSELERVCTYLLAPKVTPLLCWLLIL